MLAMLCLQPGKRQQKVQTLLIWLLTFSLVAGLYTYIYSHGEYALSYGHFSGYNVTGKMHRGLFFYYQRPLACAQIQLRAVSADAELLADFAVNAGEIPSLSIQSVVSNRRDLECFSAGCFFNQ